MKISSRGEYALRALIVLGQSYPHLYAISELSQKTLVTENYLEKILLQIKGLGYVESKRGHQGGYRLALHPRDIVVGDVIRKLEGPLAPMGCASVTAYEPCELEGSCMLKPLWVLIREVIAFVLEQTTLEDLITGNLKKPGSFHSISGDVALT